MINIYDQNDLKILKEAGRIVALCHEEIRQMIKPGVTTKEINDLVEKIIREHNATPSFLGYGGFPASVCASPNDIVVHGFPTDIPLQEGDIISVDIGAYYQGFHGDSAWTYPVGKVSDDVNLLLEKTEESLYAGLNEIKEGIRLSDVSHAIQKIADDNNLGIVREFTGHGVGRELHEEPAVYNYGAAGKGPILKEGMVLAVEPMLNLGTHRVKFHSDGWTVSTADRKQSAHFEHTIVVTKDGYEILTKI